MEEKVMETVVETATETGEKVINKVGGNKVVFGTFAVCVGVGAAGFVVKKLVGTKKVRRGRIQIAKDPELEDNVTEEAEEN